MNLIGQKFGRLKVLKRVNKKGLSRWRCACDCGTVCTKTGYLLKNGGTRSCGCLVREHALRHPATTHGMTRTPEYKAFKNAQNRCKAKEGTRTWLAYGKHGIKFLFNSFEQWYGELGKRPSSIHSVHRINPRGNYEPGNVKWATKLEQNRNKR